MKRSLPVALVALIVVAAGAIYWQKAFRARAPRDKKSVGERTLNIRPDLSADGAPRVRVNLTPSESKRVQLVVDGPYAVRPVGDDRVLGRGERLAESTVTATAIGFRIGDKEYRTSRLEIFPDTSPAVWVNGHKYRGSVRIYRRRQGEMLVVNVVPLEDYIASVVDSEMPAAFPDDARRAQAIVARTYVLYHMNAAPQQALFDVYATTRSQKYLGVEYRETDGRRLAGESANSRQLTLETAGSICTYEDRIFCTYYSAVCGGQTTAGTRVFTDAAEPLQSVECQWCQEAELYRWTVRVSRAEAAGYFKKHFEETGKSFGRLTSIRPARNSTLELPFFEVSDGRNRQTIASTALVRCFPPSKLPSPRFTIEIDGDALVFQGKGHGHGVGFCQWGARGLAASGRTCLEILQHYYPGSHVVVMH